MIGIIVGHTFYFLEWVFPVVAEARGWRIKKVVHTPALLHYLCGSYEANGPTTVNFHAPAFEEEVVQDEGQEELPVDDADHPHMD